jgi:predicted permease
MSASQPRPPLLARLLLRLCRLGDRRADIEADVRELFEKRVATAGSGPAKVRYLGDVWSLLQPSPRSWTSGLRSDLRDATRALVRTPVQTTSLFLCLLLGSTVTVMMFTIINALFGGTLPGIVDRDRLAAVAAVRPAPGGQPGTTRGSLTVRYYQALPDQIAGVSGIAYQFSSVAGTANVDGRASRLRSYFVNGQYFATLGTRPATGRLLDSSDDHVGAPPVAVIGFEFWRRMFDGRDDALGRMVSVGPEKFTIVGVLPPGFSGIGEINPTTLGMAGSDAGDLWMPISKATWGRDALVLQCGNCFGGSLVVRLAPGTSLAQAERELRAFDGALNKPLPGERADRSALAVAAPSPRGYALEPFRLTGAGTDAAELIGGTTLLMAVPLIVLAIAAVNVASVQVSRTLRRVPELASRVALGATRFQLVRLITLETTLLALAAGGAAWFLTSQAVGLAEGLLPIGLAADSRVLMFALATPCLLTLFAALGPTWRVTGFRILDGLQHGAAAGISSRMSRARRVLLAGQLAISVALLGIALHLQFAITSSVEAVAPRQDDVMVVSLRLFDLDMPAHAQAALRESIETTFRKLPGIVTVGLGAELFSRGSWGRSATEGTPRPVTPEWFQAIGARPVAGRLPTGHEPGALVVNETLARRLGGASAALGSSVSSEDGPMTIVGVVEDGYERGTLGGRTPMGYRTVTAVTGDRTGDTFYLKGPGAATVAPQVIEQLAAAHPQLAPYRIGTVTALVDERYHSARLIIDALAVMSGAALLLAAVGLFGSISHASSIRMREFGVRLALGARPADIGRIVVRDTATVALLGLGLGLVLSTLAASAIRSSLFETALPWHPVPIVVAASAVLVIAVLAAFAPARRVMAIDPVSTLRGE